MQNQILVIGDMRMAEHMPGPGHPDSPRRLGTILAHLPRQSWLTIETSVAAQRTHLEWVHHAKLINAVEACRGEFGALDPDTRYSPHSADAAYLAAGAGMMAVDAALGNNYASGFALTRPPGHHAEPDRAMGFCLFNTVAVAAEYARRRYDLHRILVIDWDVHHGNGTQKIFWNRNDVLFFSMHQWPFYPGTGAVEEIGEGPGRGYTVNCPLPPGLDESTYGAIIEDILRPLARRYKPELVLVSAGFDAHRLDPLGGMSISSEGFAQLCGQLKSIAREEANGALAFVLEGGYHHHALSRSVNNCIEVLAGHTPPSPNAPSNRGAQIVKSMKSILLPQSVRGTSD